MSDFDNEVNDFLKGVEREVADAMREAGEAAVAHNVEHGDYRNRTGRLRRSNYYEVEGDRLVIGNSAPYASNVEARGYMVCSEGALIARMMLDGS